MALNPARDSPDFTLVHGGAWYRLLRWVNLTDDVPGGARRQVMFVALLAWLPLLLLSAFEGRVWRESVAVPFLLDVEAHIRFLVALPLLIVAEFAIHRRLPPILRQFLKRRLKGGDAATRFEAAVASASRLRSSVLAEALLVAFVYGVGVLVVWRHYWALEAATWYATPSADGSRLTLAGVWYACVSVPIVQFLLLRWYWRLFIWVRFLWQVSRIELRLMPAHPDGTGGLGFLASTGYAFTMFAAAHGALAAGPIASRIFFTGASLPEFANAIGLVVLFVLCVVLGPLLVFAPQLAAAKHAGLVEHGALAERYVGEFEAKWFSRGAPPDEPLVGTADIQSLADLGTAYDVVRTMRIAPITLGAVEALVVATLVPILPLVLTMIPLGELMKKLLGIEL